MSSPINRYTVQNVDVKKLLSCSYTFYIEGTELMLARTLTEREV